jgi:prepilin-type N-terminal cleavage/methylation domain-containing protein
VKSPRPRRGVTLIELLCTMLIISVVTGVSVLAIRSLPVSDPNDPFIAIASARRRAVERSQPVSIVVRFDGKPFAVSLSPDGFVAADSALRIDPLTGGRIDVGR